MRGRTVPLVQKLKLEQRKGVIGAGSLCVVGAMLVVQGPGVWRRDGDIIFPEAASQSLFGAGPTAWAPLVTLDFPPLAGGATMVRFLVRATRGHSMVYRSRCSNYSI